MPVSPGIVQQIMPVVYTNGSLDTWTILCLTAASFEPFMFPVFGSIFAYVWNILNVVILYDDVAGDPVRRIYYICPSSVFIIAL